MLKKHKKVDAKVIARTMGYRSNTQKLSASPYKYARGNDKSMTAARGQNVPRLVVSMMRAPQHTNTLKVWTKDAFDFIEERLPNGIIRRRAIPRQERAETVKAVSTSTTYANHYAGTLKEYLDKQEERAAIE